jgi:hypothetical protein
MKNLPLDGNFSSFESHLYRPLLHTSFSRYVMLDVVGPGIFGVPIKVSVIEGDLRDVIHDA